MILQYCIQYAKFVNLNSLYFSNNFDSELDNLFAGRVTGIKP